jgi:flagellar basal-body rod protein FlgC
MMNPMQISRTGLDVEWLRLSVIAENIANANTTRTGLGEAYRAMRLVSGPRTDFATLLEGGDGPQGVAVYGIEPMALEPRRVLDKSHPHADAEGFVEYPGLDHAGEMTLLIQTARAYEANVTALNIARQMYGKALEIGRRS